MICQLNAHSSRSHAILCVKVSVTSGEQVTVSTASAIDLAGSEDNRRTDNVRIARLPILGLSYADMDFRIKRGWSSPLRSIKACLF